MKSRNSGFLLKLSTFYPKMTTFTPLFFYAQSSFSFNSSAFFAFDCIKILRRGRPSVYGYSYWKRVCSIGASTTFHWPFQGGSFVMVYFWYSSSLNVYVAYIFFVLDSHLATLWESNCPFGFLLVMFPLGSSYFVVVFLSLWCLWWEVLDNCIDSWSLPSFLFYPWITSTVAQW